MRWMRLILGFVGICAVLASVRAEVEFASVVPGYEIQLPRDEGSHPQFRTEWWYLTGWLEDDAGKSFGFQVTFFRHRPGTDEANPSQFATKQILFAHASLSDPANGKLLRAEKMARAGFGLAEARQGSLDVHIDEWRLNRGTSGAIAASVSAADFKLELKFKSDQPPLLQGRDGYSQKTPQQTAASYYYSLPQLQASGRIEANGKSSAVRGVAWLDHEWFSGILDEQSQGWDWIGLNLNDGSAIMALRMRTTRGESYWQAATVRDAKGNVTVLEREAIEWRMQRQWQSPRTGVKYPVEIEVRVGARTLRLRPLMDDQENDARASTGTLYWEGAMRAFDGENNEVGKGYLEMTGYGDRIRF